MLERAARERDVATVCATVSPTTLLSRELILQDRFTEVGEQWDDKDGLEIIEVGEAARNLLELHRTLHLGKVAGGAPLEVVDHAGAVQAAVNG